MLGDKKADWVAEQAERMEYISPSPLEELFLSKIKGFLYEIIRQPYFKIGDHGYFLDFLVPKLSLAIEIDGVRNHYNWRDEANDWDRDFHFEKIGIKTVRFTAVELRKDNFRDEIFAPRVRDILSGKIDINDHYLRPKCERFKGVETVNRSLLRAAVDVMEQSDKGDAIIIETDRTYLMKVLDYPKGEPSPNRENYDLLTRYYDLKREKWLKVGLRFTGNRVNQKPFWLDWMVSWDIECALHFQGSKVYGIYAPHTYKPAIWSMAGINNTPLTEEQNAYIAKREEEARARKLRKKMRKQNKRRKQELKVKKGKT